MTMMSNFRNMRDRFAEQVWYYLVLLLFMTVVFLTSTAVFALPAHAQAVPGENWEWRNPLPQGYDLHGVVWSGNQFVAVGDERQL